MQNPADNPHLKIDDMGLEEKARQAIINAETLEFQRLCFETFHVNKDGKAILEKLIQQWVMNRHFNPDHAEAGQLACYFEGFKDCVRTLDNSAKAHLTRVNTPSTTATA